MRAKWNKTIFTAILIGAALGISAGALSAYMTSSETATNTFTAGEVKIDLQEPAWRPEDGKHLVAKQTVLKDPKIKNTGKNSAYVFMTVQVPVRTLTLYNDAGRKEEYSETTELFNLKKNIDGNYETLSDTNSGNWVLLKDRSTYGTKDESFTTYVYAYRVPVAPNATSDALFDAVQLKNVIEGYSEISKISTKDEYPITINGYAIQATDVVGSDGSDVTDGTVTADDLLRMYDTYVNQNGTGTGSSMNLMTDPSTQYKDGKIVIPELPKKTGYKNDGLWHDDHGHTYAAGIEVTVTDEMKKNGFNLHVNWEPIMYTVRFDANGGSGTMEDLTMTYDEAAALPANAFTSDTNFIGWSLSKTGSINFKDGAMFRNLSETDGDTVTLYALWKQNKFKVTYNANGGYFGTDTSKISNTVTYQKEKQLIQKISKTDNVNEDGSGYSGGYGDNVSKTEVVTIPGAAELKVTITYQTEGSSYDWVCMWEGAHPEYTAGKNYNSSKTGKLAGRTKTTKEYTVTGDSVTFGFRSDGSSSYYFGYYAVVEAGGVTVKNGTFIQPSHLENLFVGWYTDAACTDGREFSLGNCESDTTVYAKWKDPIATLINGNYSNGIARKLQAIANDYRTITAFQHSNIMPDMSKMTDANIISTEESDIPIYCWKDGSTLKWWAKAKTVKANTSLINVFNGYTKLSDISGLSDIDIRNVTNMNSMFRDCSSITDLSPLENWDTRNVTDMSSMFNSCRSLTDLSPLANWNTGNVTKMPYMFYDCRSLADLSPIANWDTGNVTNMSSVFNSCGSLADLSPIANWNTGNVTDMSRMFFSCGSFKLTDLSPIANWNTENVTDMGGIFSGIYNLADLSPIVKWDTGKVTSMCEMFKDCLCIDDLSPIANWNTRNVTDMSSMFDGCRSLTDLSPLANWNTGNVTGMDDMFNGCSKLTDLSPIAKWDTGKVTNMYCMFNGCSKLTDLNGLKNWNTGKVTSMAGMFDGCSNLTNLDGLANWNTEKVTDMSGMFYGCNRLTELSPLANWSTGNVTNMRNMFYDCSSLTDLSSLANWNTGNVKNMNAMFESCSRLTDLSPLANWSTGNVTDMGAMFVACIKLTDLSPLANWNTGNVTNMNDMFAYCRSLTDLSPLANWSTGNVTDMSYMFNGCNRLLDASGINNWNISSVTNFNQMFYECKTHPTFTKRAGTWDSKGTFTPAA